MKTLFMSLSIAFLISGTMQAQPVITHGEYYHIGDVVQMVSCDTTGLTTGPSGPGVTWDYSTLAPSGPMITTTYSAETSSEFLTSNMVATLSTGVIRHEAGSSATTYINGIQDAAGVLAYYRSYPISRRPFTYTSDYVDTFYKNIPTTGEHGSGYLEVKGDGYGTLKLPTGTYSPVLRIRRYQNELDTTTSSTLYTTTISYVWFDTVHTSPLLRIDSVVGSLGQNATIMYLANPTSVNTVASQEGNFSGYLHNNELTVSGNFEQGVPYELTMYNLIGSEIFRGDFTTSAGSYRFDIARPVAPGIYIVGIMQKNEPSTKKVIKVMKQ